MLCCLLPLAAPAQLAITEINSNGSPADFWEMTNFGTAAVNVGGYVWTDSSGVVYNTVPAGTSIAPQESVVFVTGTDEASFRSAWGLAPTVKVFAATDPGLGRNDAIRLFTSASATTPLLYLSYAAGGFTRSNGTTATGDHAGLSAGGSSGAQSLIMDPNFGPSAPQYTFATGGNFGSWQAPGGTAIGSPGVVGTPASNSAPYFVGDSRTFWVTNVNLAYSVFRMLAVDADAGQSVSYSTVSKPAWLAITPDGLGGMQLNGTPNAAQYGDFPFTIRATDNAPGGSLSTDKTFTLTIYPPAGPILLNEYNGVGPNDVLDATNPGDGIDHRFGTIAGNGGDWFELVVTGTDAATSTVDLRGWKIEILSGGTTKTLVLSSDPYWSNVMAGTILTFIENNTGEGGLDTAIHQESAFHTGGFVWSNIWIRDPVFINQAASVIGSGISIDNNNTWFTIKNPAGTVVLGPCGEGIAAEDTDLNGYPDTLVNVSSQEVLALRTDPATTVSPLFGLYTDQSSSTFGYPNYWKNKEKAQNFAAYVTPNTPPQIISEKTGSYSYLVTATDPNGPAPVISAGTLPSFLTFTGGSGSATLTNNRPLTLADAGEYIIRVQASDGSAATPLALVLTVLNPAPTVILNEYNAVDTGLFLNGGTLGADSDGGVAASDLHFGRVDSNGGDWFELVVTGNGGAGTVDMRGWRFEIGQPTGPDFTKSSMVVLSNHGYWSAVPTGTILTFIEHNTAQGGLDTGINLRNRRATLGDSWTNIWLGDTTYLTYTDQATNGYEIISGVVSGVAVDDLGTRLRIKNAADQVVFGPGGEGVAPIKGVDNTGVFELAGDPLPSVSPLSAAYAADAAGSSFGWPNAWGSSSQNFQPYVHVPTPYEIWVRAFYLSDSTPAGDPDGDGRNNRAEYGFGGDPGVADGPAPGMAVTRSGNTVTWQYARRGDDPSLVFTHQRSVDLTNWSAASPTSVITAPHPTLADFVIVTVVAPANPVAGREFFRAALP